MPNLNSKQPTPRRSVKDSPSYQKAASRQASTGATASRSTSSRSASSRSASSRSASAHRTRYASSHQQPVPTDAPSSARTANRSQLGIVLQNVKEVVLTPAGLGVCAVVIVLLVLIVGIGSCSASSNSASSETTLEPTREAAAEGDTGATGLVQPIHEQGKSAAGNDAIAVSLSAEERMATSDSNNMTTPENKTVYLTFDDGPSSNTENILNILNEYGVHATWFIRGNSGDLARVKDIWDAGNQVAIHTYTHDYESVYASTDDYWNDVEACGSAINGYLGFTPTMVRFPGGSVNSYNESIQSSLISQMAEKGLHYYDWNVSSGDGDDHAATDLVGYVINGADGCHSCCVLMHDSATKDTTVEALRTIIEYFIDEGFEFGILTTDSYGYHF